MTRWAALLALAAGGCGRLGFDARDGAGADGPVGGPDADPSQYVISATQLTTASGNSFVDLAVDWPNRVAYLGTRESGQCFLAVDLDTTPPSVIARRGPPETTGGTCLGVTLVPDNTQLLVSTEAGGAVELWDLGDDPRVDAYQRLATTPVPRPRRIGRHTSMQDLYYVARGSTSPGVLALRVDTVPPYFTPGASYAAPPCPNSYNAAAHLASGFVVTGCSEDASPVELVDDATLAPVDAVAADNGDVSGFWSAASTSDGGLVVLGGWVSAAVVVDASAPFWRLLARWDNGSAYRGATVVPDASPRLWAATSDGHLEVLELGAVGSPRVLHRAPLGVPGEAYAVAVEPAVGQAVVVTNGGYLVLVDITRLPPTDFMWPAFP